MGSTTGCASLAGFAQLGLGIALIIIATQQMHHAGPQSCIYGAANVEQAMMLCNGLELLAWLTVTASLIISVTQGALSLLLRVPPYGVEVLGRTALGLGWLATAIFTTVATVQADKADPNKSRTHWRHVGLGFAWAMAVLSALMGVAATVGTLCIDFPIHILWCCFPCLMARTPLGRRYNCCELCAMSCCLYWCLPRSWFSSSPPPPPHTGYQPLPTHPPGPTSTIIHVAQPVSRPPLHPASQGAPASRPPGPPGAPATYPPPRIIATDTSPFVHHSPGIGESPMMAPVYAPFSAGPAPYTVGWGVPVAPPPRAPWSQQPGGGIAPPPGAPHAYPQVPGASSGAWYPPVEPAGGPSGGPVRGSGAAEAQKPPTAPPLPEPHKDVAPSAPPYPRPQ